MGLTDVFNRLRGRPVAGSVSGSRPGGAPVEHVIRWDGSTSASTRRAEHDDDLIGDDEELHLDGDEPVSTSSTSSAWSPSHAGPTIDRAGSQIAEPKPGTFGAGSGNTAPLGAGSLDLGPAPRNKQELLNELRKNYTEVVSLVRKVDAHLDHQDSRGQRMLEIAERLPGAIEHIEALQGRHTELMSAVGELTRALRDGQDKQASGTQRQIAALENLHRTIGESNDQTRQISARVAGELGEFRTAVGDMVGSTQRLGEAINTISQRDDTREQQLRATLEQTRKWTIGMVIFLGVAGACAIAAVVIALMQPLMQQSGN